MVLSAARYLGGLRVELTHGPSGQVVTTDAPVDNHGRGEAFSPTDLLAASVAACMLTVMGIRARALGVTFEGATAHVEKVMSSEGPRRVARVKVNVDLPGVMWGRLTEHQRAELISVAENCPVRLSLSCAVETEFRVAP